MEQQDKGISRHEGTTSALATKYLIMDYPPEPVTLPVRSRMPRRKPVGEGSRMSSLTMGQGQYLIQSHQHQSRGESALPYPEEATIPDSLGTGGTQMLSTPQSEDARRRITANSPVPPRTPLFSPRIAKPAITVTTNISPSPQEIHRKPLPPRISSFSSSFLEPLQIDDHRFSALSHFDTVFLIDDSASMLPYWNEAQSLLHNAFRICAAHDRNGIDIYFVHHRPRGYVHGTAWFRFKASGYQHIGHLSSTSPPSPLPSSPPSRAHPPTLRSPLSPRQPEAAGAEVMAQAEEMRDTLQGILAAASPPRGSSCPLGRRLSHILDDYLDRYQDGLRETFGDRYCRRPLNLIVVTAGQCTDKPVDVVVSAAMTLDRLGASGHQVGVQFCQVGALPGVDRGLRSMDSQLVERLGGRLRRDMVDTVKWEDRGKGGMSMEDFMLKIVLGGVVRKYDRIRP